MRVHLEYTAQVKRAAGTSRETIELPAGVTLSAALRHAAARHGEDFRRLVLTDGGGPQPALLLFHCDAQVRSGSDPKLSDGDTITIMSPISGG
jgi:molybdopterin converting factor small subunit